MPVIPKITDVYVTIDINHPQPTVGLKNPAIFVKGDTEAYKQYMYLDAVEADFDSNTSVYKQAQVIFDQDPAPEAISVITFTGDSTAPAKAPAPQNVKSQATGDGAEVSADGLKAADTSDVPTQGIAKAAFDYFYENWEFALLADYNKDDAKALADLIEHGGYDAKGFHIFFAQFNADNQADAAEFKDFTRTFTFYHTDKDEYYAAALAAKGAQPTIGKVSWKFVGDLADVTPESLPASQIIEFEKQGLILYVPKGTADNQTDDKNLSGNYIDFIHGLDFVKSLVENNLQATLNNPNGDGTPGKVSYDTQGLAQVQTSLENSLNQAYNQSIIASDKYTGKPAFTDNVPDLTKVRDEDIAKRILRNVRFEYTPSSAINEIHVNGQVNALI